MEMKQNQNPRAMPCLLGLVFAGRLVGGEDEESPFQCLNKSDVFKIKGLMPLVYFKNMLPEKFSN